MSVRAFELVPVIDRLEGDSKCEISCIECWEDNFYVGTTDGFVQYFVLQSGESPTGRLTYRYGLKRKQRFGSQRPVQRIQAVPAHRKLIVLCDGKLMMLQMQSLSLVEDARPIKGVTAFCRDELPALATDLTMDITAQRKKGLYNFDCSSGVLSGHKKLRDLDDGEHKNVIAMARNGRRLCVAEEDRYCIINLEDGSVLELISFDPALTVPYIKRLDANEFLLLTGTEGMVMGIFATATGASNREILTWPFCPSHLAYQHPYITALGPEQGLITVHSVLDQKNKQVITFMDGRVLNDNNGQIFLTSHNKVLLLSPVGFEMQINELLAAQEVDEALSLAQATFGRGQHELDAEEFKRHQQKMLHIQRRAGLCLFRMKRFSQAFQLLKACRADPRELLVVFPDLLPQQSSFRDNPRNPDLPDIDSIGV